jgi:sugar lactone lactonase YvrE
MEIRVISKTFSDVGEGPLWNLKTNSVAWVDITGKRWHQADFTTGVTTSHSVSKMIGAIVEREKGGYVAAVEEGFAIINDGDGYQVTEDFLPDEERMNDAKADALGRWWMGSNAIAFTAGKGRLHSIDSKNKITTWLEGATLPNGLGWSPDNKKFYLVDSLELVLWVFDFDLISGAVSNKTLLHKFEEDAGLPDGLTVADDGSLLIAMWDGARIKVLSPSGSYIENIELLVSRPTSCTFGGKDGKDLIVTTSGGGIDLAKEPLAGQLLAISDTGYSGSESTKFNG